MRRVTLPIAELGVIAATRAMGAAGAALLVSGKVPPQRRKRLGWILLGIGVVTTVPLVLDLVRNRMSRDEASKEG